MRGKQRHRVQLRVFGGFGFCFFGGSGGFGGLGGFAGFAGVLGFGGLGGLGGELWRFSGGLGGFWLGSTRDERQRTSIIRIS